MKSRVLSELRPYLIAFVSSAVPALVFTLNGYLNGRQKTVWTMVSCTAGALLLRIPMVAVFGRIFGSDLGLLGTIAPAVSGFMAAYTLAYVIIEGRRSKRL